MASPFDRIGRALVKYFKPIRVVAPHNKDQPLTSRGFKRWLPNRRLEKIIQEPQTTSQSAEVKTLEPVQAPKIFSTWLDLVVSLLSMCRNVTNKLRRKAGLEMYQRTLLDKGKHKFQAIGSIVDSSKTSQQSSTDKPFQNKEKRAA